MSPHLAASVWLVRQRSDLRTALLVRYVPTAGLRVAAVVAVVTTAIVDVRGRSRRAGAMLLAGALAVAYAGYSYARAAWRGVAEMERLAFKLDQSTPCVRSCSPDCLTRICWNGQLARESCLTLQRLGIGPFRP